jgi:hypothetical protein
MIHVSLIINRVNKRIEKITPVNRLFENKEGLKKFRLEIYAKEARKRKIKIDEDQAFFEILFVTKLSKDEKSNVNK